MITNFGDLIFTLTPPARQIVRNVEKTERKLIIAKHAVQFNPRTAGGLSHLRTAGGGGHICAPRLTRKLRNASTSGKQHTIGLNKLQGMN